VLNISEIPLMVATDNPLACEQLTQLLDSPEANLRLFAIPWPKGRQFECIVEPVVVQFYSEG
jgi:hypothetical protein